MSVRRILVPLLMVFAGAALAPAAQGRIESSFSKSRTLLTVLGDANKNRIAVSCDLLGNVRVNSRLPDGRRVACARVDEVDVFARAADDVIVLTGVDERFGRARFEGYGSGTGAASFGGAGDDRIVGSATAFNLAEGNGGSDEISGGERRDSLDGGRAPDELTAKGARDALRGGEGGDRLLGGGGKDRMAGEGGPDRLFGGPRGDLLLGGVGRDKLRGGGGQDHLFGGPGRDLLRGGAGRDELEQG